MGDGTSAGSGMTATISSVLTGASQLIKDDLGTLVLSGNTRTPAAPMYTPARCAFRAMPTWAMQPAA